MNKILFWWRNIFLKKIASKSTDLLHRSGLLSPLALTLKGLIWASLKVREELQRNGVTITPTNYYSTVPSIEEIRKSFEYQANIAPPYMDTSLFDEVYLKQVLEELEPYASEFTPPISGCEENPAGYFWENSQFSHSDAMAYYAAIRYLKPRRVIEVGSGFSTLVASAALEKNGCGEIICIEPFPRTFLHKTPRVSRIVKKPAQQLDSDFFNQLLNDDDILFIDSTHTVKLGSDCIHLYLRILPALRKRVMVHVHDIFLPEALPQDWALHKHIYWTEQYLLMAYLLDNPRVKVWFASNYHRLKNIESLTKFMHERGKPGGGSFWFKLSPRENHTPACTH